MDPPEGGPPPPCAAALVTARLRRSATGSRGSARPPAPDRARAMTIDDMYFFFRWRRKSGCVPGPARPEHSRGGPGLRGNTHPPRPGATRGKAHPPVAPAPLTCLPKRARGMTCFKRYARLRTIMLRMEKLRRNTLLLGTVTRRKHCHLPPHLGGGLSGGGRTGREPYRRRVDQGCGGSGAVRAAAVPLGSREAARPAAPAQGTRGVPREAWRGRGRVPCSTRRRGRRVPSAGAAGAAGLPHTRPTAP